MDTNLSMEDPTPLLFLALHILRLLTTTSILGNAALNGGSLRKYVSEHLPGEPSGRHKFEPPDRCQSRIQHDVEES